MSIADLGALGELVGAVAVLLTLGFLVAQLRQNTVAIRSASRGASAIAIAEFDRGIADNPDLSRILLESFASVQPEWNALDAHRFLLMARSLIYLWEDQYVQSTEGAAPTEQGELHVAHVLALLDLPAWKSFWEAETRGDTMRRSFVDAVNQRKTRYRMDAATMSHRPVGEASKEPR